jgi:outer membrane cobalamin receptor
VARNFSDISGVVSASQNTNLDLGNPNLQPELYSEVELDLKLNCDNRITLDFPYFKRKTENLITTSYELKYTNTFTNIGLMEGDGI